MVISVTYLLMMSHSDGPGDVFQDVGNVGPWNRV